MKIGDRARVRYRPDTGFEMQCPRCARLARESYWPITLEFWTPHNMTACKACILTGRRLERAANSAAQREAAWWRANREKVNAYRRARYAADPRLREARRVYYARWRLANTERLRDYQRQWRADKRRIAA